MEQTSQVMTVELEFDGETFSASYHVEHDLIHANIDGHLMTTPLTVAPAGHTVKAMLLGHLLKTRPKGEASRLRR